VPLHAALSKNKNCSVLRFENYLRQNPVWYKKEKTLNIKTVNSASTKLWMCNEDGWAMHSAQREREIQFATLPDCTSSWYRSLRNSTVRLPHLATLPTAWRVAWGALSVFLCLWRALRLLDSCSSRRPISIFNAAYFPYNCVIYIYIYIYTHFNTNLLHYLFFTTPICFGHEFWPCSGSYKLFRCIQFIWQRSIRKWKTMHQCQFVVRTLLSINE
jgi:hypothetical protein